MRFTGCQTTPIGPMEAVTDGEHVLSLRFVDRSDRCGRPSDPDPLLSEVFSQLAAYFSGRLRRFTLPLCPAGTPFQRQVWAALLEIPYGQTASYGQIAAAVGNPKACRAVGMANHRNPIAILIPCHRVIAADGGIGGYGAGIDRKRFLLNLERKSASCSKP